MRKVLSPAFIGALFLVSLSDVLDDMPGNAPEDKFEGLLNSPPETQERAWEIAEVNLVQVMHELIPLQEPWEGLSDLAITALVHLLIGQVDTPMERRELLDRLRAAGSESGSTWRSMSRRRKRVRSARTA